MTVCGANGLVYALSVGEKDGVDKMVLSELSGGGNLGEWETRSEVNGIDVVNTYGSKIRFVMDDESGGLDVYQNDINQLDSVQDALNNPIQSARLSLPITGLDLLRLGPDTMYGHAATPDGIARFVLELEKSDTPTLTRYDMIAGDRATFEADNFAPGKRVYFVASDQLGKTPLNICPGQSVHLELLTK